MKIVIGSDHAGFELKQQLADHLKKGGHELLDVGTNSTAAVDYPDFAQAVGEAVAGGKAERGILLCGSGVGASVAANKLPGVRAGLCHDGYSAHQGVEHDDVNVLVLGARIIGSSLATELVDTFLKARFTKEERHVRRLNKVLALEARAMGGQRMNTIRELDQHGQSIWLDFVSRGLIARGELKKMIDEWGIQGLTSNPSIFQKAVEQSADYASLFEELKPKKLAAGAFFEQLAVRDIRDAADLFQGVYQRTHKRDGYVSIEVSPKLANDAKATIEEARRLWKSVGRDNVMIKIPGTTACLPAIEEALSEGMNVNITLLFSQQRYADVVEAFLKGLELFGKRGGDVSKVASVASFFVSRIDTLVDKELGKKVAGAKSEAEKKRAQALLGKVAIANAKLAYEIYQRRFGEARWAALAKQGARPQRLLWASTSTKNPDYRDVIYIEELVGRDTVNTVPQNTLEAFLDHGRVRDSLTEDVEGARRVMQELEAVGVSMKQVTDQLVEEGVRLFDESFDKLIGAIAKRLG